MTLVIGAIAADGIVCGADGRVKDENNKVLKDNEIKLFELSPLCILMPDGGVFEGMDKWLFLARKSYANSSISNVTDIARSIISSLKQSAKPNEPESDFIFIGYDLLDGHYQPRVYKVSNDDWRLKVPSSGAPFATGGVTEHADPILHDLYVNSVDPKLRHVNRATLRALKVTTQKSSEDVNGQLTLWNLKPGNKNIKKFNQRGIDILTRDLINL